MRAGPIPLPGSSPSTAQPLICPGRPPGGARLEPAIGAGGVPQAQSEFPFPEELPPLGGEERWHRLQQLRRDPAACRSWLAPLEAAEQPPEQDLLEALVAGLDPGGARSFLTLRGGSDQELVLRALERELRLPTPALAAVWLEPLLAQAPPAGIAAWRWLELLGRFRDPRCAARLRGYLEQAAEPAPALLPLLGLQRDPRDAPLLQRLALQPGPGALRRSALEGLALGLVAWPLPALQSTLMTLAADLDPALAAQAVDLLARLPGAQPRLRRLARRPLEAGVAARLQRRLRPSPLVLVVHGRTGGLVPVELQQLAAELAERRGAPVLLQPLTAPGPEPDAAFRSAVLRSGGLSLVPLLLLPGGHVRNDLPGLVRQWRQRTAACGVAPGERPLLWHAPFLGAWPDWQQLLARLLAEARAGGRGALWLHHPLEGPLARRYLDHLQAVLQAPGVAAPYSAPPGSFLPPGAASSACLPLTLAANRLTESLQAWGAEFPPLLQLEPVRQFLIEALEMVP